MNLSGLNFSALPAINIVYRFFICAVLFALVAAILLAFSGPDVWQSRWHPHMLAITHCFTLGFITTVMMGAMLQILPVIGGIGIPKVKLVANTFLVLHVMGTGCLIAGFIFSLAALKIAAMIFLTTGFAVYLAAVGWVLSKKLSQGSSILAIRFAVLALLVTLMLGLLLLARNLGWHVMPFDKFITDMHAVWGIAGWFGLLIIAVSFQIIPMFHVAPEFNVNMRSYIPKVILSLLLVLLFSQGQVQILALLLLNSVFIGYLCHLLSFRKRKIPDATVNFWRLSMLAMTSALILYSLGDDVLSVVSIENQSLVLAAIVVYLYVVSIILGMLLKIMPFLSYTHLQQRCLLDFSLMPLLPNMHQLLPKKHGNILFYLHLLSEFSLFLTLVFNQFYLILALTIGLEFFWLLTLLVRCKRLYNDTLKQIDNR